MKNKLPVSLKMDESRALTPGQFSKKMRFGSKEYIKYFEKRLLKILNVKKPKPPKPKPAY